MGNITRKLWFFYACLLGAFVISRFIFWRLGVRFDDSSLEGFWQYLDIETLKGHQYSSIYYLHSQPPGFNFFLMVVLSTFPTVYTFVLQTFYLLCSLVVYILLFKIFQMNQVNQWASFALSSFFILSPEVILYENWLYYTWPIATLILVAAYAIHKFEKMASVKFGLTFLLAIVLLCITRSAFHLIYLILCIVIAMTVSRSSFKWMAGISSFSLLIVLILFIKNLILFDFFGASSWLGMNLWKMVYYSVQTEEIKTSLPQGKIQEVVSTIPFSSLGQYPPDFARVPQEYSDIPVLSNSYKSTGYPNYNHYGYTQISGLYQEAALSVLTKHFDSYLKTIIRGFTIYCMPSWSYVYLEENYKKIEPYAKVYSLAGLRTSIERIIPGLSAAQDLHLSSIVLVLTAHFVTIIGLGKRIIGNVQAAPNGFYLFLIATILYVMVIVNSLDIGENSRFRVMIDPILYTATVLTMKSSWKIRGRKPSKITNQ